MHHLIELLTNPWIVILIIIIFFGEFIPFTSSLYKLIGKKALQFSQWFLKTYEMRLYSQKESVVKDKKIQLKFDNIIARILFFIISSIIIIFLEIFWELGFKSVTKKLEKSGFASYSKRKLRQMPPWAVLSIFALPFVFMELLGIFALTAFVSGQFWLGVSLYIIKVLFFIPVHFILHVAKDKLLSITWFKRRYEIFDAVLSWFKQTQTYIKVHNLTHTIKAYFAAIKNIFSTNIAILKKAFEQSDLLSDECEKIRQEILNTKNPDQMIYKKFFDCINTHLKMRHEKS